MATLENRGRSFRIIFRHGGVRYARSLTTRDDRAAQARAWRKICTGSAWARWTAHRMPT